MWFNPFKKKKKIAKKKGSRREQDLSNFNSSQQDHQSDFYLPEISHTPHSSRFNLWLLALFFGIVVLMLTENLYLPGELSLNHRFLDANCESCHSAGNATVFSTLSQAFKKYQHNKENELCTDCHQFNNHNESVHNVSLTELKELTGEAKKNKKRSHLLMAMLAKNTLPADKNLSCISCHQEHQGTKHDLAVVNNKKCQSCHQSTFIHFEDHPEFTHYPNTKLTNIKFDHQSHIKKKFDEERSLKQFKPKYCNDCHQPDNRGGLMLVKGFEHTCSNCHLSQIQGESQAAEKGIVIFNLMGMDIETLNKNGFITGGWPEDADSKLSNFMHLLLSSDQAAVKAMETLNKVDTLDLRLASSAQLQAANDLIWATKKLFFSLQQQGHASLKTKLESILKIELSAQQFATLSSLLSPDLFNSALNEWLPSLNEEVKLYQQNDLSAIQQLKVTKQKTIEPQLETVESGDVLDNDNDFLLAGDDDLLFEDEDLSEEEDVSSENRDSKVISAEEWVSSGGWYRSYDSLYYRPSTHADMFLKSWLDLTIASKHPVLKAIFSTLANPKAQGMCLKCHNTSDANIYWQTKRVEANKQHFTHYSHDRHLAMDEIKNCATCHLFKKYPDSKEEYNFKPSFESIKIAQCKDCHSENNIASESCTTCHNYHIGEINLKIKQTELSVFSSH